MKKQELMVAYLPNSQQSQKARNKYVKWQKSRV